MNCIDCDTKIENLCYTLGTGPRCFDCHREEKKRRGLTLTKREKAMMRLGQ